jgi:crossover junction endonuclease MUS81
VVDEPGKGKGKKKKEVIRGKEMFFADRVQGEGRRKIGDALSREVRYQSLWACWTQ